MIGEKSRKLVDSILVEIPHCLSHGGVEDAAPGLELSYIGNLLNQGMPKRVPTAIEPRLLLKQFCIAETLECSLDLFFRTTGNVLKDHQRKLFAYNGADLQKHFFKFTKPIYTRSDD